MSSVPPESEEAFFRDAEAAPRPPPPPTGRDEWALRVVLPLAVAALFIGMLVYERGASDVDVRIIAPLQITPGEPFPVRVFVFDQVGTLQGPQLVERSARAGWGLPDQQPERVSEPLSPAITLGLEGRLQLPQGATGRHVLYVDALLDEGETARVQRTVEVTETPDRIEPTTRVANDEMRYFLHPRTGDAPEALQLEPRVPAGACVPELPCEVLVWVGGDAPAAVDIAPSPGVRMLGDPPAATHGIARLHIVVSSLHAAVTFRATQDGAVVARRQMQTPLAPGAVQVDAARYILPAGSSPVVWGESVAGDTALAAELFRGGELGVLTGITSVPLGEDEVGPPDEDPPEGATRLPPLDTGLYHLQAHSSPFDTHSSGAAALCAYDPAHGERSCVTALAGAADARERQDAFAAAWRAGGDEGIAGISPEDAFRFLSDARNIERYPLPPPSSGVQQAAFGVDRRVSLGRMAVAGLVAFLGVIAALVVLRRSLAAAEEAGRVLEVATDLAEEDHDRDAEEARIDRMRMTSYLAALLVFGAFLMVSFMVLSRS